MKIIITESQFSRIISEQEFDVESYMDDMYEKTEMNPITKIAIALVSVLVGTTIHGIQTIKFDELIKRLEPTFNKLDDKERECVFNKLDKPPFNSRASVRKFRNDKFLNLLFDGCVEDGEDIKNEIIAIAKNFKLRHLKNTKLWKKI